MSVFFRLYFAITITILISFKSVNAQNNRYKKVQTTALCSRFSTINYLGNHRIINGCNFSVNKNKHYSHRFFIKNIDEQKKIVPPLNTKKDSASIGLKPWHIFVGESFIYVGSMVLLNEAWYKNYGRSSFHFFNDNDEWLQIDKLGHTYAAYQLAYHNMDLFQHVGYSKKKAMWISSGIALLGISSIEIYDGFSSKWGASIGDFLANTAGVSLFLLQESIFDEQIIRLKYSYKKSPLVEKRPAMFGQNIAENLLKDYNGISFWLSGSIQRLTTIKIPAWIAIAAGYKANGMIGGIENPYPNQSIKRYRQFLLSLDIDWQKIATRNKYLKLLFKGLNMVKIPFPAISFEQQRAKFLWLP